MRKPEFCLCENKDADQLCSYCAVNAQLISAFVFLCSDSTTPPVPKSEISSCSLFSVTVQAGLCRTWSETLKTGFLAPRLI